MAGSGYLKDRVGLYVPFFISIAVICAVILLLPYETVYVRDRTYLAAFLATVCVCVAVFMLGTLWKMLKVFLKDALYLSRLKERSLSRWFMHLMILGGFALMFVLDIVVTVSLDLVRYRPMIDEGGWAKLWLRDFGFDLVGLMMLVGLLIAAYRRFVSKPAIVRTELPDAASILFLLAVVLGGFVLEGMGIAGSIPDHESGHEYSFVGYLFSLAMPESAGDYYDQVWLVHGVMSALLIAYIPFSKLFHMIATPVAIEAERMLSPEVGPR
jgi:hypothetical protein